MRGTILIKKRLLAMLAVLTLLFCLVGVRIGSLTLFQGEMLTERGVKQWTREGIVSPSKRPGKRWICSGRCSGSSRRCCRG